MSKLNKLTRSALRIKANEQLLKCPICDSPVKVHHLKSITCSNNHSFDLAKQGYLNVMKHHVQTNYNKELFDARKEIIVDSGLFDPFTKEVTKAINEQSNSKTDLTMIDMGSGEGSHLNRIRTMLQSQYEQSVIGVGIDISKVGILAAAKNYEALMWLVADLSNLPLQPKQFDVIINILSPSNYKEFQRVLKDDGFVLKVIPRSNYLRELRSFFYKESEQEDYSNTKIIKHFNDNFELVNRTTTSYTKVINESTLSALVKMTPLTWGMPDAKINKFLEAGTPNITIDFDILIGKKKGISDNRH